MAPLSVFCFLATLSVAMARALWSTQPALQSDLLRQAYPVGNGRLGGMVTSTYNEDSNLMMSSYAVWSSRSGKGQLEY